MRSPLTESYLKVKSLINEVDALTPDERGLFLDLLLPESDEQPNPKKTRKKRTASATGRRRGMPDQEGGNCTAVVNDKPCDEQGANLIHDPKAGYAGYHEFQPGKSKKAAGAE
jgi:hypothetical protein